MKTTNAQPGDVELGDLVRDSITSFEGVAIGLTTWLNGCRRISVQPRDLREKGAMPVSEGFDETQLIIVEKHVVDSPNRARSVTGGPRPEPSRAVDPRPRL